jgi:hypothetical protein
MFYVLVVEINNIKIRSIKSIIQVIFLFVLYISTNCYIFRVIKHKNIPSSLKKKTYVIFLGSLFEIRYVGRMIKGSSCNKSIIRLKNNPIKIEMANNTLSVN